MKFDNATMQQALRLTQAGDLQAATRAIQQALGGIARPGSPPSPPGSQAYSDAPGDCVANNAGDYIDGEFFVVDDANAPDNTGAKRDSTKPWSRIWPRATANPLRSHMGLAPTWIDGSATGKGDFQQHHFVCDDGQLHYKLYIPPGLDTVGAPLLLMLHGCTQTPDDFARGTRMNELAVEHGYVVAWPAQSIERNPNRCWNWFRTDNQQRGRGEPAILSALTRHLVATYQLDAKRVFVAGLSAGGAMAAVLANTHPDIFAAIGVHSGLPIGLASDIPSAFAAMGKGGEPRHRRSAHSLNPVPAPVSAIVFHGDSDTTVHPRNGHGVIAQSLGNGAQADRAGSSSTVERDTTAGGRSFTRTIHREADGRVTAEHWVIHGAAHAWSGGDARGSYTDPCGPDASAQMLRFFDACRAGSKC